MSHLCCDGNCSQISASQTITRNRICYELETLTDAYENTPEGTIYLVGLFVNMPCTVLVSRTEENQQKPGFNNFLRTGRFILAGRKSVKPQTLQTDRSTLS